MSQAKLPKGLRTQSGVKIAVVFKEETFERIKIRARKESKGFSAMVDQLCQIGMFDLDESDALEPMSDKPDINTDNVG